jgi:hypothetical protein
MPAEEGVLPPAEDRETPRVSACLNRLKASLLSLPGPAEGARLPVDEGVRPLEAALDGSSSECENDQPDDEPVKITGWQSCPAATIVESDAKVKAR